MREVLFGPASSRVKFEESERAINRNPILSQVSCSTLRERGSARYAKRVVVSVLVGIYSSSLKLAPALSCIQ